ncbi:MAG: restriction endonuclease subunit S, partial [Candidatus Paceibacterota bacterium]
GGEGGGRKGYKLTKLGWIPEEWDLLPVKEFLFSVNIQFLTNLLKYLDLSRLRNKGGQPLVSQKPIYELIIQLPSLEEQQKIASVLSSADLEISNLQNHLDKLKNQKKGLMQKLLTGEVRVKIENNIYNPKNVSLLKSNIIELAGVIDEFGKEMAKIKKPLNVVEQYYNSHLKRVRANLEGVIQLLDSYANCYIIIIPIAQIMRSLLTDFLTAYYMFTFYDRKDTDHTSFSNELKLFDRDACNAMVEWMESEEDLHKFNENLPPISEERIEERKKGFEFFFSEILDDNKKRKKPKDIRSSSNPKFFGGNKTLKNPSGIINEKYKIDRLKEMEYFKMPDGYMLYKYYSQFYHESKLSSHLAGKDTVNDNFKYLRWGLIPIYHMIDNSIRLFMTGENGFSKRLEELKLELEAIGND